MALGMGMGLPFGGGSEFPFASFFTTPGLVTLPSWLTFACGSVRTAQVSASTIVTGIAANQPVANTEGLQHETQSTNYCTNTSFASDWSPAITAGETDPADTLLGAVISATAGNGRVNTIGYTTTVSTVSIWVRLSTPNTGARWQDAQSFGAAKAIAQEVPVVGTGWHRISGTYNGANISISYGVIGDAATNAIYAFPQREVLSYATSFIPTSGTVVTRLTSTLKIISAPNNYSIAMEFIAKTSSANCPVSHVVGNSASTSWFGFDAAGKFRSVRAENLVGANVNTWAAGDLIKIRADVNGTTVKLTLWVNNVLVNTETLTHTTSWTSGAGISLLSDYSGTNHVAKTAVKWIGWLPK